MEKRAIIAAMLMAGLLMVYQFLFVQAGAAAAAARWAESGGARLPGLASDRRLPHQALCPRRVLRLREEAPRPPERTAVVDTPLYRAEVGSNGGEIKAWELRYRGEKPLVVAGLHRVLRG